RPLPEDLPRALPERPRARGPRARPRGGRRVARGARAGPGAEARAGAPAMSLLGGVIAVAWKESVTLRRDPSIVRGIVAQAVILTAVFGFALRSDVTRARWAVLDADDTAASRALLDRLAA